MGLNAVVFKSVLCLPDCINRQDINNVDSITGQVELREGVAFSPQEFLAAQRRLGNFDAIILLRDKIAPIFSKHPSVILEQVLYDSFHSGDHIPMNLIPALKQEVERTRARLADPEVDDFLDNLEYLIASAEEQMNPIVFV